MTNLIKNIKKFQNTLVLALALSFVSNIANATIVTFKTSLGDIKVNLYDETTPESVANFLNYVDSGAFGSTLFHRSVNGFILQGGGYLYNNSWPPITVQANVAVKNEPIYSNIRGTIAYAKLGGQPDSATSEFFFNLANNSANLDNQNSGFTVFGEVIENGMDTVDAIATLQTYNLGGAFGEIPLQNYTSGVDPDNTNIILITAIEIDDPAINTASGLTPQATTRGASSNSSSGSGALGLAILFLLAFRLFLTRK